MRVGIADADLLNRKKHRFPNLVCMKLSTYHKQLGDEVIFVKDFEISPNMFDRLYISKVFTDTKIEEWFLKDPRVVYGGTGFYFDKAPGLAPEIEHCKPDYHFYDEFVKSRIDKGEPRARYREYLDYSIGFLTRKCFRGCEFCVNRNYKKVELASPLNEFLDTDRPKIALLDDNFFGYPKWKDLLTELNKTGKPFKFKQGLDERLLTPEKCEILFSSRYDGEITFAFDNFKDYDLISKKLKMIRRYTDREVKFYVLTGFNPEKKSNKDFWFKDIVETFLRIELLSEFRALPYIMRHEDYLKSPYVGFYKTLARWCNQPGFYRNYSFNQFVDLTVKHGEKAPEKYRYEVLKDYPVLDSYFNIRYGGG